MFSWQDIIAVAIQIEQNGEQLYRAAAAEIKDPELAAALAALAEDEAHHQEKFKQIAAAQPQGVPGSALEKMARALLREMVAEHSFSLQSADLLTAQTVRDIVTASIAFEQDTLLFYEMIEQMASDRQAREILQQIAAEEKRHILELQQWQARLREGSVCIGISRR